VDELIDMTNFEMLSILSNKVVKENGRWMPVPGASQLDPDLMEL